MKKRTTILLSLIAIVIYSCADVQEGKHLFILSGQSNMVGLKPEESFTPIIEDEYGKENVIVVKNAYGGMTILNTKFSIECMTINDDQEITVNEKITKLRALLKKYRRRLVVRG